MNYTSLWGLLWSGGVVTFILVGLSVVSIAIILERLFYFKRRSQASRAKFLQELNNAVAEGRLANFVELWKKERQLMADVAIAGLTYKERDEKAVAGAMERQTQIETLALGKYLGVLGTIGSTAVYIGLFGTVLGIIRAFMDISSAGLSDISVIIAGIAQALVCTAAGLCVAVPAVMAYNFFMNAIDRRVTEMELCASEVLDMVRAGRR
jgi:biopolymer transport protein ExbB/TolQ